MVVSCLVGARNWTCMFWESNQCSQATELFPTVIIWFMVLEIQSETDKIIPLQRQRTRRLSLHQILLQQEWHQCIYKIKPSWCNHLLSILLWLLKWQLNFCMSFQENIKNITQRLFKSLRRLKVTEL